VEQHELRAPRGARKRRKRVGRGNASGHGTYSGRGLKGQQARSGFSVRPGFEGGQTPLIRRLPRRRGFRNPFRVAYTPVNLKALAKFPAGSEVTPESLRETGVVRSLRRPIKILSDGELTTALTVRTHRVSPAARVKIEAAGGTVEELTPRPPQPEEKGQPRHPPQPEGEDSMADEEAAPAAEPAPEE
jgi:large subunit ribosomal protein L15